MNRDIVAAKLAELADRIHRVRTHVPASADDLANSRDTLDLVSFNLMLAVQACADVALARAVGLRNVVAHGYGTIDVAMVHAGAVRGVDDLERYAQEIGVWMTSRG